MRYMRPTAVCLFPPPILHQIYPPLFPSRIMRAFLIEEAKIVKKVIKDQAKNAKKA